MALKFNLIKQEDSNYGNLAGEAFRKNDLDIAPKVYHQMLQTLLLNPFVNQNRDQPIVCL